MFSHPSCQTLKVAKILKEERAKEAAKPTVIEPPPPPSQAYLEKLAAAREALKEAGEIYFAVLSLTRLCKGTPSSCHRHNGFNRLCYIAY